jgi:hypothetical protein
MEVKPGQLERQMQKRKKRLQAAEMKFMSKTLLHFWTTKEMKKFKKKMKVEPVSKFIQNYRANWKDHTERMDS